MEQITNYVKPELIVVAIALYFVGMALKQAQAVKDKYIPLILGGISIAMHLRYRTGYCNGNFYSDYTGNTDCRSFYIREPDCKTGK
mgnify:CR=1 FL=1